MSHMVIYRTPDGKAAFQQVDDLPAAVAFVEKIRNEAGVENGRIYRLEQVSYRFEPYYQVRIETGESATTSPAPAVGGAGRSTGDAAGAAVDSQPAGAAGVGAPSAAGGVATGSAPTSAAVMGTAPVEPTEPAPVASQSQPADEPKASDAGNGVRRGLFGR